MPFGMGMSLPAATLIVSNQMGQQHQGVAGSLVTTIVNYSISIALGIAGTVEVQVNHRGSTPDLVAWGIQCAKYSGVALSGVGALLGLIFFIYSTTKTGWKPMGPPKPVGPPGR
jgi:hypothetical protein